MNTTPSIVVSLVVVAGMILSACTSEGTQVDLQGTSWRLVSYGPAEKQIPAATGVETSLEFGTDGTVNGNAGCNSFGGNYAVKNNKIIFSQMLSTMMACQGVQMDQERTTLEVLNGTVRFIVKENQLTIYDASGAIAITLSK